MNTFFAVKQLLVFGDKFELAADEQRVDPAYVERALNEWDSCAVEVAGIFELAEELEKLA